MGRAAELVTSFLAHYSSQYYDPAKAHEYYIKNRELQGRQSMSALKTDAQKQAWTYAKAKIAEAKKGELSVASEENKRFLEGARSEAKAKRKEWSEKLKGILGDTGLAGEKKQATEEIRARKEAELERVAGLAKAETTRITEETAQKVAAARAKVKQISEAASQKIASLPPIPKGVSAGTRERLAAKRAEEIARIRGEATDAKTAVGKEVAQIHAGASKAKQDVAGWLSNERKSITANAKQEQTTLNENVKATAEDEREAVANYKEDVGTKLKATVDKARVDYEARKQQLKAKYEQVSNTEYEAIKRKV